MMLYRQLRLAPVRAADASPSQQRLAEERRAREARIRRAAVTGARRDEPDSSARLIRCLATTSSMISRAVIGRATAGPSSMVS